MNKRAPLVVAVTAAAALFLSGCSAPAEEASNDAPTEITFQYLWAGLTGARIEQLIQRFNSSQDDIVVTGVSNPDQTAQLASMSSTSGQFDVSSSFGDGMQAWASKGILAPLDEYGIDVEDFVPAAVDQVRYEDSLYAMPFVLHTHQLIYNTDLLAAAGLEGPPETFAELADYIDKLTITDENGNITQLGLGVSDNRGSGLAYFLETLGIANGGTWDTADGVTPTDPKILKALDWYKATIVDPYGADKLAAFKAGFGQYVTAQDAFYQGKIAMIIDGEWQSDRISRNAAALKWDVAPVPTDSASNAGATILYSSTLFIPANSKHPKEAAEFLKFMLSSESMLDFSTTATNLPSRLSLASDSIAYAHLPKFNVWLDSLANENLQTMGAKPYLQDYLNLLRPAFDTIELGTATPADAMESVKDEIDSQYGG